MPENINGLIERVTYHNPANGFAVLKVKVKGRKDLVALVGNGSAASDLGVFLNFSRRGGRSRGILSLPRDRQARFQPHPPRARSSRHELVFLRWARTGAAD